MDFIFGIAIIAGIVVVAMFFNQRSNDKRKAEAWVGSVESKKISDVYDSEGNKTSQSFDLVISFSDGKKRKVAVAKETYDELTIGDAVEKTAGVMDPVKRAA